VQRLDRIDRAFEGFKIFTQKNESLERLFMQCWHPEEADVEQGRRVSEQDHAIDLGPDGW
jgi:hypothetical protein